MYQASAAAAVRAALMLTCAAGPLAAAYAATGTTVTLAPAVAPLVGPAGPMLISSLAPPNPVHAVTGDLSPLYGRINPFYGDVNASYGRINPFYGRINPFYGRINPFFGDISSFWGRINPFIQLTDSSSLSIYGTNYDAFWGKDAPYKSSPGGVSYSQISGFWSKEFSAWSAILPAWNSAASKADAQAVATAIQTKLLAPAADFWGSAMKRGSAASAAAATAPGTPAPKAATPSDLFAKELTASGVTLNPDGSINATSLLGSEVSQRAMLFLNLYDDLMDYAGTGHVDWWMSGVKWSPALAATQGSTPNGGLSPTVGMIDFVISQGVGSDGKAKPGPEINKQIVQYGSTVFADGHGAAVASLIMGAVDGSGVLGVMPAKSVNVMVYDPYDQTGTTNWEDVGKGISVLSKAIFGGKSVPMGVLNASLGVPGWTLNPGWNDALALAGAQGHDLVIAAGNDGSTQTDNVPWNFALNPTILIVGSVGVDGTISNFSNRPGEACLLPTGATRCSESNKLKYRFIVAPGELILVSDGLGGHMRQSGTSLAAPLVSGAIALLQNRWPWLSKYPNETAKIILDSAKPLGANPGADPVYGVGELDIAASQSPLDWSRMLYFKQSNGNTSLLPTTLSGVVTQLRNSTQSAWDSAGLSFAAIELVGATFRDFEIPLSSKLVGQNVTTIAGGQAYQTFLSSFLRSQSGHFAGLAQQDGLRTDPIMGFARSAAPAGMIGDATLRVRVAPSDVGNAFSLRRVRYDTDAVLVTDKSALAFGFGNGAAAIDGSVGFAFSSDYQLGRGGANPLLGLASGGAYAGGKMTVAPGLAVGVGTTSRALNRNLAAFGIDRRNAGQWVDRYAAQASNVSVAYAMTPRLTARAGYTRLHEDSALLGIQSLDRADLGDGSVTEGGSIGFDLAIGRSWMLSGTGTLARSRADRGQLLTRNLASGSAQLALVKSGLFARADELRLTVASPLHNLGGRIDYNSIGVVDRDTGELGVVTQSFSPQGATPVAVQAMYGMALPRGNGEFSLFGRADHNSELAQDKAVGYAIGGQLHLAF